MRNTFTILCVVVVLIIPGNGTAQTYFVAPDGDDNNPGTMGSPRKTIQSAVSLLGAGDTLFLREGSYHEEVLVNQLNGTADLPVVIMAYRGETVTMDGTVDLEEIKVPGAGWQLATQRFPGTNTIYKMALQEDIWQLFVRQPELMDTPNAVGGDLAGYRMQVVARWPNAATHPCDPAERIPNSTEIVHGNWWSFRSTWADASAEGTTFTTIECVPSLKSLSTTGLSFEGGTAILSVIGQGPANIAVEILEHDAGSNFFTHTGTNPNNEYHRERHFIVEHLNAIDQPGEWYFDRDSQTVYLWPEDNTDPNGRSIRGKTMTRAFDLDNCSHIRFVGIGLFATTVRLDGEHVSFTDCAISYPDMPRRVLGEHDDAGPALDARNCSYFGMRNCVVEYSQYHIIEVKKVGSVFDNNYFHHLGIMGMGTTGCFMNVNTFTHNTLRTIGHRAAVKANSQPESGRIQSWNILDGWGYLYANDGVGFQTNQGGSVGSVRAYNWFIRSEKPGHRYDGPDEGLGFPTEGLSHHLVGLRTKSTSTNIKGDYNQVYHYLDVLGSSEHGGIAIRWNTGTGEGNAHTIMRNCAADGINIGKWDPLPCIHSNNWDASKQGGSMLEMVPAADLLDFRPEFHAPLVNTGYVVPGINDGFLGPAPDIGAYEWGDDTYWIPGYQSASTSMPIPFDGASHMPLDRDLIFLHGYRSEQAIVYVGIDETAVFQADTISSSKPGEGNPEDGVVVYMVLKGGKNIVTPTLARGNPNQYDPSPYLLTDDPSVGWMANQTYYWRSDAIGEDGTLVKGDVWSFTPGNQTHLVKFNIFGHKEGNITPASDAWAFINGDSMASDSLGKTYGLRLTPGVYSYQLRKKGYSPVSGTVQLGSDTLISDTLDFTTYQASLVVVDEASGDPIPGASLQFQEQSLVTDSEGTIHLSLVEYDFYQIAVSAEDYWPIPEMQVEIYSDTTLFISLSPHYLQISLTVVDGVSGGPLERALIYYNDQLISSTGSGEAVLEQLRKGKLIYRIEHAAYFSITDSLIMNGDTTLVIQMTPKLADILFEISDASGPVSGARVVLNGALTLFSDTDGKAKFINKLAREKYGYSVTTEGFESVSDSLNLELDTVINVLLQPLTGIESSALGSPLIYPNPVMRALVITGLGGGPAEVRLVDMKGRELLIRTDYVENQHINVAHLPEGLYIVQITTPEEGWYQRIMKLDNP